MRPISMQCCCHNTSIQKSNCSTNCGANKSSYYQVSHGGTNQKPDSFSDCSSHHVTNIVAHEVSNGIACR